jgi:hypothetical protein
MWKELKMRKEFGEEEEEVLTRTLRIVTESDCHNSIKQLLKLSTSQNFSFTTGNL